MNTPLRSVKIIGSGFFLALVLSFSVSAYAGPGPDYWQRMGRAQADYKARAASSVKTPNKAAPAQMSCEACQTVVLRESEWIGPPSKGYFDWFTVGAKHSCVHCGGEIKVVRGRTTNTMQHNCPMCGKDSLKCFVTVQTPAVKT